MKGEKKKSAGSPHFFKEIIGVYQNISDYIRSYQNISEIIRRWGLQGFEDGEDVVMELLDGGDVDTLVG